MSEQANRSIVGRTITGVRQLTSAEVEQIWGMPIGYGSMPLVIKLDDGSEIIPVSDPECNDAGALLHFQQIDDQFLGEVLRPPSDESDTE